MLPTGYKTPIMTCCSQTIHYARCNTSHHSQYTDEEIKGGALLRVAFLLMKYIFSEDLGRMLPGFLGLLEGFSDSRTGLQYLEAALRYAASGSSHIKSEEIEHALKGILDDEGGDLMTTLAQQWIEEGHQRGIQEGVLQGTQQGRQEGRQEGIINGLVEGIELAIEVKFGTPAVTASRMETQVWGLGVDPGIAI
jgi:hypothetical protein